MSGVFGSARQSIIKSFSDPNPDSLGVFKTLEDIYPSFSAKIFQGNAFMQMIVMSNYSPMHILDYPICGRCETLAMWNNRGLKDGKIVKKCSCFADGCGSTTFDPPTFRDWLKEEMRKKATPQMLENLEFVVDVTAMAMMKRSVSEQKQMMDQEASSRMQKLGIVNAFGEPIQDEHCEVTLTEASSPVDLAEEGRKIAKEEGLDYEYTE